MFIKSPKIFAHLSALPDKNFVISEYILNKQGNIVNLFHRFCPHRMYPLADPGTHIDSITCKFHGFQWDANGIPINNSKKLNCGTATVGRSGLIFKDFIEPAHQWVDDLEKETTLVYSHSLQGKSEGSWLWLMDAEADYLHVQKDGIHPRLSEQIDLDNVVMDQGDGWIFQEHFPGWWSLYIYPYTFVEHKKGCLSVNTIVPADKNIEWKFEWITQFYYAPDVPHNDRIEFETLETVFREDVAAIEKIKTKFFPVTESLSKYEYHCIHWGRWIRENLIKD
jgi:hypothetical protein